MTARDRLAAAVASVENSATPAASPFLLNVDMGNGRAAQISLPDDITDTELVQLVAIIAGPGRRAQSEVTLVRAASLPARA